MKSLKGRFIRTNILMIVISATLVFFASVLLLFVFSVSESDGFVEIVRQFREMGISHFEMEDDIIKYIAIWIIAVCALVLLTCTLLSANLSKAVLQPIRELRDAAENITDGNLEFDVLGCEDIELNALCESFEEIRKKLKANAIQAKQIEEERNMLIANLSHDMRTPITTIKGYVEGIKDGVASSKEKQEQYLDTIYSKAIVLEKLVDNMTEYSELELGRLQYVFEFVELNGYLEDLAWEYRTDIEEKGFTLDVALCKMELQVVMDRAKMKRVFDNLISNALKYSKEGGSVSISTKTDQKGALISVSDTGKGIRQQDISKVFDGFYRGDAARSNIRGNGLGLSIAKQIIEKHHGKIWVKSEENVGTEVYIYIPLRKKDL